MLVIGIPLFLFVTGIGCRLTEKRRDASRPRSLTKTEDWSTDPPKLTGEPTDRFEAFTACPSCKTMDWHTLTAVTPLDRTALERALWMWEYVRLIDVDVLTAALKMPDDMFFCWLKELRIYTQELNPRAGERADFMGFSTRSVVSSRIQPDYVNVVIKFPFTDRRFQNYAVVRQCPCGERWGQGSRSDPKIDVAELPATTFQRPLQVKSEASTDYPSDYTPAEYIDRALKLNRALGLKWVDLSDTIMSDPDTGRLYFK